MPQATIISGNSSTITLTRPAAVHVRSDAASAGTVQVHLVPLNAANGADDDVLAAGESATYRVGNGGETSAGALTSMTLTAAGGNVTVRWGIGARL